MKIINKIKEMGKRYNGQRIPKLKVPKNVMQKRLDEIEKIKKLLMDYDGKIPVCFFDEVFLDELEAIIER